MIKDSIYFREYQELENKYYNIVASLPTNFPKAINLQEEKKKFFKALNKKEEYNPQILFTTKNYKQSRVNELLNFKIDIQNDRYGFKKLLKERIEAKINEVNSHSLWGFPKSTNYVIKSRGKPSTKLLKSAMKFCRDYRRKKVKFSKIDANQAGDKLKSEVYRLTKENISIIYNDHLASKVNISPKNKVIILNPNEKFTTLSIKRLNVHEIGVHYMRYFNAKKFHIKLLETGTANYIETEEGLAAYMEQVKGVASDAQLFIYAGRVIATHYALTKSFYEVFKILKKYNFKDSDAFSITYRAKRNLCDTSKPGGFTKDYVYYSGYYKIKKYVESGYDIKKLFIGKIKIEDLNVIEEFIKENLNEVETILDEELNEK